MTIRPTYQHPGAAQYRRPGGPWDVPTVTRAFRDAGDREDLVVDGGRRLSTDDVEDRVARVAGGLVERGVGRGDVVAWTAANCTETVLVYRAVWRLGAVAVPVHHRMGPTEVGAALAHVHPTVVLEPGDLPDDDPVPDDRGRPGDPAVVLFTSGSTGTPKGVIHTHRSLVHKASLMAGVHGLTRDDSILMPAPLAHVSGLLNAVLVPGVVPMKTVLVEKWDPGEALRTIADEGITFMVGPPTFFLGLIDHPDFDRAAVASLRLVSSGGAGVTPAFVERATSALGALVKRTYGSTEAPTVTTSAPGDDPERAQTTDGRPTGDVRVRISDPASGRARGPGEVGEVWLRGPELFAGYLDQVQTDAATSDGWFRTGDLASIDDHGWLTIEGRLKDVIIRGGENIAAGEVEAVLEAHPAVHQAVAVGEPDDRLGERVAAFVVAPTGFDIEACRRWCAERGITKFKWPERVVLVDAIPTLSAGKPDRAALRALLDP